MSRKTPQQIAQEAKDAAALAEAEKKAAEEREAVAEANLAIVKASGGDEAARFTVTRKADVPVTTGISVVRGSSYEHFHLDESKSTFDLDAAAAQAAIASGGFERTAKLIQPSAPEPTGTPTKPPMVPIPDATIPTLPPGTPGVTTEK